MRQQQPLKWKLCTRSWGQVQKRKLGHGTGNSLGHHFPPPTLFQMHTKQDNASLIRKETAKRGPGEPDLCSAEVPGSGLGGTRVPKITGRQKSHQQLRPRLEASKTQQSYPWMEKLSSCLVQHRGPYTSPSTPASVWEQPPAHSITGTQKTGWHLGPQPPCSDEEL